MLSFRMVNFYEIQKVNVVNIYNLEKLMIFKYIEDIFRIISYKNKRI